MLSKDITKLIGDAMKAHDEVRLSTLRLLSSAFNYEKIEKQHELTDEEEMTVIKKQVKQRRDSIEAYDKADRADLSASEKAELTILLEYLPPEMSDGDLEKIVFEAMESVKPTGMADMGKVIGYVKGKASNADPGKIAMLVKSKLGNF